MAKYGKADPSVYQLRDMNRRITQIEKRLDRQDSSNMRQATAIRGATARIALLEPKK